MTKGQSGVEYIQNFDTDSTGELLRFGEDVGSTHDLCSLETVHLPAKTFKGFLQAILERLARTRVESCQPYLIKLRPASNMSLLIDSSLLWHRKLQIISIESLGHSSFLCQSHETSSSHLPT
jgi:hypothetical protein